MAPEPVPIRFAVFNSKIELPFYSAFFDAKLNHDKLDEAPKGYARAEGRFKNFNTYDAFKRLDKQAVLNGLGTEILNAIKDGTIYSSPSLLASYNLVSFADLKKYRFMYWFGFPALHSDPQWKRVGDIGRLSAGESTALVDSVCTWQYKIDGREHGFFLAKKIHGAEGDHNPYEDPSLNIGYKWIIGRLGDFETGFFNGVQEKDQYISFVDPSSYPDNPGWPLRNLLILIRHRYHLRKAQIICFRDIQTKRHEARSIILPLEMDPVDKMELDAVPKITGWERNASGKLAARVTALTDYLEPSLLADAAVDLNLRLMKWRVAPNLDLDAIKQTKCLLLGAGTLGGNVAQGLLGWGVKTITFVDNGSVSLSNPVRQPLFKFEDSLKGGVPKAPQSAKALKEIYPGVETAGHVLSVPMLGHPINAGEEIRTKNDFVNLRELIMEHDAIFLLMDSRESRWLPTVMGKAHDKLVLTAALGFDSYVVLRHGAKPAGDDKKTLGCYFCSDVVAPGDSMKDMTLDQQCTVSRPGASVVASGLLVEIFSSVMQHALRHHAPASKNPPASAYNYDRDPPDHPLGIVPHQIRGFLGSFQNMVIRADNYPHCSACSTPVLDAYCKDGFAFVKKALNDKDYIVELSGLAEVQRQAEKAFEDEPEFDEVDGMEDDGEII
ncbi:Ubiquitin-like modifier-activating enzyme ATG7 [Zalerion maritima]|uniref:Ubiquitin-like modifier-activating enzyme ATG7 n=1 Tax=Zalerion maritima TaxID=339359 RepID=A0AAD5RQC2_9PEZI|nr:Ubiquitin-like modifier-activating enzyme ATG7 [Zalerion maritima]